ncbi:jg15775 [Pararge aegeria aegeria]|uniref:Jg15775 protein n=1 Tax=Pararge aegeria aegeria TaxID=348720 RepID=A0A8S4RJ50_9NEOP|nr:jg15775 [Pararge aegeria aegeria]
MPLILDLKVPRLGIGEDGRWKDIPCQCGSERKKQNASYVLMVFKQRNAADSFVSLILSIQKLAGPSHCYKHCPAARASRGSRTDRGRGEYSANLKCKWSARPPFRLFGAEIRRAKLFYWLLGYLISRLRSDKGRPAYLFNSPRLGGLRYELL